MRQPTDKATLPNHLRDLERRLTDRERSNPIARASFHDGTRTRGAIGKYAHPDSTEDYGAIFYDASGNELLRIDDTSATVTTGTFVIADSVDGTKQAVFDTSAITPGVTRTITMPDADVYLGAPAIGTATIDTSNDLNDGLTSVRSITSDFLGAGWSVSSDKLTYTGSPVAVFLQVNVSFSSAGAQPSPVVELWKGATKLAAAHTGYIRNNSGHDEASANFTFVDTAPGANPAYHIQSSRGSTVTDATNPTAPSQFSAHVFG